MASLIPVPQVLLVRCHYCSKHRSPHEILRIGTGGAVMCWHCYERHNKALLILAGQIPAACQECGVTVEALQAASASGDCKMSVCHKDGVYQFLCFPCSERYVRKRVDLFGSTQFGHQQKLK